ncbi:MAG: sugar phosphate isomerase/epimerase [Clostridia bacterium]|nr:sugar phosphate isomerase/epimerase [Clostridia bacterium]
MKLGVLTNLLGDLPLEEALKIFTGLGIEMVEIGCGGYPGKDHADPDVLLNDEQALADFKALLKKYNVEISALSCHANPVHPDKAIAQQFDSDMRKAVLLAEKLGVDRINTFSGCPGDCENSRYPNWAICPWPNEYQKILEWQWNEVLIPYWKEFVAFAKSHGVTMIGLEMHPGFCVYNTDTLLKLRHAVGPEIGANLDLSHLMWQGMDSASVIRALGKENAIFHFHAKDTKVDPANTAVTGVLDTKPYGDEINRSWIFRAVGYGHDVLYWRDVISNLRMVGYDYAISIEHEDSLMSQSEGLKKAVDTLKQALITEDIHNPRWF